MTESRSEHHPSCTSSDRDLVWLCNQCGARESAESLEEELMHVKQQLCKVEVESRAVLVRVTQQRDALRELAETLAAAGARSEEELARWRAAIAAVENEVQR